MTDRHMRIVFSSGLSELTERNSSFDSGVLRVAYTGKNRNNSFISKQAFERSVHTIYNCPVVCRYDRDSDAIGAHDAELVTDANGDMRFVNLTQPVGVVPESARWWWEEIEDASGIHEYLCTEVLLWKRQEAYRKIRENGVTDESMEIFVKEGSMQDGTFVIERFEFTAFCLLGTAEPCFESASLEVFSGDAFKAQFAEMMRDLKTSFSSVSTPDERGSEDIIHTQILTEGGEGTLEQKNELLAELLARYGLSAQELDFDIEGMSLVQIKAELDRRTADGLDNGDEEDDAEAGSPGGEAPAEPEPEPEPETDGDGGDGEWGGFALSGEQFRQELIEALEAETTETCFGTMPRYWYVDYDPELREVYCYDTEDWKLYGFKYTVSGDAVAVVFSTKVRKKFAIVDFDGGEQQTEFAAFVSRAEAFCDGLQRELCELRDFRRSAEHAEVFAEFADLAGLDDFEALREGGTDMPAAELREKCYAIRGRHCPVQKFSADNAARAAKVIVLSEPEPHDGREPYNGIFAKYGISPHKTI